ncbi:hypothetical protein L2755_15390 [Shewanella abyssi]|uniref:hypothetical protein n=1 Tax=Shewanella abyssi TaxID=311789 RepID=UPI00200F965F|nr:hypothetical protein [Shewanella abyssi]MCL1051000.1 hypothetical protein [Shewanella abyssi]
MDNYIQLVIGKLTCFSLIKHRRSLQRKRLTPLIIALFLFFPINSVHAVGGDFSLDFTASAPLSYDHNTGGGAYNDRTVGRDKDIVESLEGGDYACGDTVSFLTLVSVDSSGDDNQTIELDFEFTAHSTGQQGVALSDVTGYKINYFADLLSSPAPIPDTAINTLVDKSTITEKDKSVGTLFKKKSTLEATYAVDNLDAGDEVVVRVDVLISCDFGSSPTGNMQARLAGSRVTHIGIDTNGEPIPVNGRSSRIAGGDQTVPFKNVNQIEQPMLILEKTVTTSNGDCSAGVETLYIDLNDEVKYCYKITNTAVSAPLLNLKLDDDNATPLLSGDDLINILINGLTDEDGDSDLDDLAAGQFATAEVLKTFTDPNQIGQMIINTAVATADNASDADTAEVRINAFPVVSIDITKLVSVDGGTNYFDANDSANAVSAVLGTDIFYKFIIKNTGEARLVDLFALDPDLVVNFNIEQLTSGVGLGVGEQVVIDSGILPLLRLDNGCSSIGNVTNIAKIIGTFALTNVQIQDTDPAVVNCIAESLLIKKEVSVDGGNIYNDANTGDDAPVIALGEGAIYRITVTNNGSEDIINALLNDTTLGIVNYPLGTINAGQIIILTESNIVQLDQAELCQVPGDINNTATANGESQPTTNPLSASDSAFVRCVSEQISLLKEIRVEGGEYSDANDSNSAPAAAVGDGAEYRITLTNKGTTIITNIVLNDPALNIVNYDVTPLLNNQEFNPGDVLVLTSGNIAALKQTNLCLNSTDFVNIATVNGVSQGTLNAVSDSDPAVLRCFTEGIRLVKEVSVDGGDSYHDANDDANAPNLDVGAGALYKITLTNIGSAILDNIVLNDLTLGIVDFAVSGTLAPGASRVLDRGTVTELYQAQLCDAAGFYTNIASISAQSVPTNNPLNDTDNAVVNCIGETAGLLIIDEDGIDNNLIYWLGNVNRRRANNGEEFTADEVNDQIPGKSQRAPLPFFVDNIGNKYHLFTGQVGDEGWFAPQAVPGSWGSIHNYINGVIEQGSLDKISDVTPLRATGLKLLEGGRYCAIVYDSDISINYDPLNGNLQGETLGIAAFYVEMDGVNKLSRFSSSILPTVLITVLDPDTVCHGELRLLTMPKPPTSSEPFDIDPDNPSGGYQ